MSVIWDGYERDLGADCDVSDRLCFCCGQKIGEADGVLWMVAGAEADGMYDIQFHVECERKFGTGLMKDVEAIDRARTSADAASYIQ